MIIITFKDKVTAGPSPFQSIWDSPSSTTWTNFILLIAGGLCAVSECLHCWKLSVSEFVKLLFCSIENGEFKWAELWRRSAVLVWWDWSFRCQEQRSNPPQPTASCQSALGQTAQIVSPIKKRVEGVGWLISGFVIRESWLVPCRWYWCFQLLLKKRMNFQEKQHRSTHSLIFT